ncbi:hypothetical protein IC229_09525 [Spirosoma sp. BT702]|uniref:Uncharacterized protein n=1 Tax=Spirosoma profusum TaxID=2771354 RepID=A0A926XZ60_9BACT|nr:hypothetical protein [Spirosoma profusum]MBD2700877.1 hypothetical protein [Spirosoma profusum]
MFRFYPVLVCILVGCLAVTCVNDYPATAPYTPPVVPNPPGGGLPGKEQSSPNKRLFLSNDKVKVAIDLNMGGAINYLAEAGSNENMVNNNDLGRQLQTSIYGGPYPYSVNGKQPVYEWRNLGWNPVQTGDYYNHPAQVVSYQQGQNTLYVKTIPKIWPLFDEPADCTMQHWIELKDNTIHVRCRIEVSRFDTTHYEGRTQETPCVYLNAPYYRQVIYNGLKPFTNDAVSEYTDHDMRTRYATENWIALLNTKGRGVGLYRSNAFRSNTASFGQLREGNEYDGSSSYINNCDYLQIDHNGQYEYEYTLVVGSIDDIRKFAYSQPRPASAPNYQFVNDRQGWYYFNTQDRGWPIQNALAIQWARHDDKQNNFRVMSPLVFWRATDVPKIYIQAAFRTQGNRARFAWKKPEEDNFVDGPSRYVEFPIIGDGQLRTYEINLSGQSGWDGVINQISLNSPPDQYSFEKGSTVQIRSITSKP